MEQASRLHLDPDPEKRKEWSRLMQEKRKEKKRQELRQMMDEELRKKKPHSSTQPTTPAPGAGGGQGGGGEGAEGALAGGVGEELQEAIQEKIVEKMLEGKKGGDKLTVKEQKEIVKEVGSKDVKQENVKEIFERIRDKITLLGEKFKEGRENYFGLHRTVGNLVSDAVKNEFKNIKEELEIQADFDDEDSLFVRDVLRKQKGKSVKVIRGLTAERKKKLLEILQEGDEPVKAPVEISEKEKKEKRREERNASFYQQAFGESRKIQIEKEKKIEDGGDPGHESDGLFEETENQAQEMPPQKVGVQTQRFIPETPEEEFEEVDEEVETEMVVEYPDNGFQKKKIITSVHNHPAQNFANPRNTHMIAGGTNSLPANFGEREKRKLNPTSVRYRNPNQNTPYSPRISQYIPPNPFASFL